MASFLLLMPNDDNFHTINSWKASDNNNRFWKDVELIKAFARFFCISRESPFS